MQWAKNVARRGGGQRIPSKLQKGVKYYIKFGQNASQKFSSSNPSSSKIFLLRHCNELWFFKLPSSLWEIFKFSASLDPFESSEDFHSIPLERCVTFHASVSEAFKFILRMQVLKVLRQWQWGLLLTFLPPLSGTFLNSTKTYFFCSKFSQNFFKSFKTRLEMERWLSGC